MVTYAEFEANAQALVARVSAACQIASRDPSTVRILPVTKTHPVEAALHAARFGFPAVAENRVQEAAEKRAAAPASLRWELIGHLQSNKAKLAVTTFDRIQSVDSSSLAERLGRFAVEQGKLLPILLQVNSGHDPAKFGCDLEAAPALLEAALAATSLRVEGLMAVAPLSDDPDVARRALDNLKYTHDA
jgi:pyridoxal phosphate enzyme (YggS family)